MAHPIRPEKYAAIDNFYTATVYNKGAEVIRMYETLLGREGFRKGMDLYFERHDGSAVTCDDFRAAMQETLLEKDANGRDLTQFERWYLQAGTPTVKATDSWDAETGTYSLTLGQKVPDTPGQVEKLPMQVPVRVGLLDRESGKELLSDTESKTFELKLEEGATGKPVPSLLRGFSAPVKLEYDYSDEELSLLAAFDTDSFNRWESMQRLGLPSRPPIELASLYMAMFDADPDAFLQEFEFRDMWRYFTGRAPTADEFQMHWSQMDVSRVGRISKKALAKWLKKGAPQAFKNLAPPVKGDTAEPLSPSSKKRPGEVFRPAPGLWHKAPEKIAYALILPAESTLMQEAKPPIDPTRLHAARNRIRKVIASELKEDLQKRYEELTPPEDEPYVIDGPSASKRRLRNVLLAYLCTSGHHNAAELCGKHFKRAKGMTDKLAAFSCLCNMPDSEEAKEAIEQFLADAKGDANVIDKWFASQARADVDDLMPRVKKLMEHPEFSLKNPNRLRSVVSVFISSPQFHLPDGSGYDFALEMIPKVDALNPQVAARMANGAFRTFVVHVLKDLSPLIFCRSWQDLAASR
eukprot:g1860.t1